MVVGKDFWLTLLVAQFPLLFQTLVSFKEEVEEDPIIRVM